MNARPRDKYFTFATFMIIATTFILLAIFMQSDFYLISLTCLGLAIVTVISAYLDSHVNEWLRLSFIITGIAFFILSMLGFLLTEKNMWVEVYEILLGAFEIIKGIQKVIESIHTLKEKNMMGIVFMADAFIEITLGILLCIPHETPVHVHVNLIAADLYFEGIIKLINEFYEKKREKAHD